MPAISILMPVYNGEAFLKQAINSVLVQSFLDWELIIINDNSTDKSPEIIKWYLGQDDRIRLISNETNLGLVASLNEGINIAKGEFLARLDCDDYWSNPEKLSKQVNFLAQNPDCALLGAWADMIDESGKHLKNFCPPVADKKIRGQILWHNCFLHSSIMVRKSVLLEAGGYKREEQHVEDYGLWLRIGKIAQFANLSEVLVSYRLVPQSVTRTKNAQQLKSIISLIKKYKGDYPNYRVGYLKWRLQKFLAG